MKLGGKSRDVDTFVDQLKEEGENVSLPTAAAVMKSTQKNLKKTEPYVEF